MARMTETERERKRQEVYNFANGLLENGSDENEVFDQVAERYGTDWAVDWQWFNGQ